MARLKLIDLLKLMDSEYVKEVKEHEPNNQSDISNT